MFVVASGCFFIRVQSVVNMGSGRRTARIVNKWAWARDYFGVCGPGHTPSSEYMWACPHAC